MTDKPYKVAAEGHGEVSVLRRRSGLEGRQVDSGRRSAWPGNRAVVHHIFASPCRPSTRLARNQAIWATASSPIWAATDVRLIAGAAPGTPPFAGHKGMATQRHGRHQAALPDALHAQRFAAGGPHLRRLLVRQAGGGEARASDIGMAINVAFAIPPGADNFPVESQHRFAKDALLLSHDAAHAPARQVVPLRAAISRRHERETILDVPGYDFNWQVTYNLAKPKFIPAGTTMHCLAHFDNSEENLANPDPGATVRWGDQTWEEMMIGWFNQTTDVFPEDVAGSPSRAQRFAKYPPVKPQRLGTILSRTAQRALESDENMAKLAFRLEKETPQVDRICASVVEDGQVRFVQVSQPWSSTRRSVATAARSRPKTQAWRNTQPATSRS